MYHKLTAQQAQQAMEQGSDYLLLDVRTPEEFDQAHIPGAVLIPDYEIADRADDDLPDKQRTLYIYCRSGRRSANVALQLVEMGYTNVYDFGGIIDWPFDTVSGAQ